MISAQQKEQLVEQGWVIVDFAHPDVIRDYAKKLEERLRAITGNPSASIANIHTDCPEAAFKDLHLKMSEYFWESEFSLHIGDLLMPILKEIIGLDILVQYMPYLRLARPQQAGDNIGYHKDTQYGQTPYELAVHIPFLDLNADEALRVVPRTHKQHESLFAHKEGVTTTVTKGSVDHMLGKPYLPQDLVMTNEKDSVPLAMKVGQMAMFSPAILHGQEVNRGNVTRVTTDLRFVHSYAPVKLKRGKIRAGYVAVSQSPVDKMVEEYYGAQDLPTPLETLLAS